MASSALRVGQGELSGLYWYWYWSCLVCSWYWDGSFWFGGGWDGCGAWSEWFEVLEGGAGLRGS